MTNRVALLGAGVAGSAIGLRPPRTGNRAAVVDPDAAKVGIPVDEGAVAASSATEAAAAADLVIQSLNARRVVRAALFGLGGVAEGTKPRTLIMDMSSIDSVSTKEIAAEVTAKGLRWLDYPLWGGAPKAATGQLAVMAGGDAADIRDRGDCGRGCERLSAVEPPHSRRDRLLSARKASYR